MSRCWAYAVGLFGLLVAGAVTFQVLQIQQYQKTGTQFLGLSSASEAELVAEARRRGLDIQTRARSHFWPHARGDVGRYASSSLPGPRNISAKPAWSWHHPGGRYATVVVGGGLLDSDRNVYLASLDGIRKFSPDGSSLWYYTPKSPICTCPSLMGSALFGSASGACTGKAASGGWLFAVSLHTGAELWLRKHSNSIGGDTSYVEAHNGVVVAGVDAGPNGGNLRVIGADAFNGNVLWQYSPEKIVWNVMAMFPTPDTTIFMDQTGGVYRVGLHNGTLLWHTPGFTDSAFSDGGVILGPDGSSYTCANPAGSTGNPGQRGVVRKHALDNGRVLWERTLPYPCNSWPAVSKDDDIVVVPQGGFNEVPLSMLTPPADQKTIHSLMLANVGHQRQAVGDYYKRSIPLVPAAITALDTRTGEVRWNHEVEPYGDLASAGDEEGYLIRHERNMGREICLPAHWSAPTFGSRGEVYVGRTNGDLYVYSPQGGETRYHTGTGPLHPGTSFAPGLMAYTDCDSLYVWHTE